MSLRPCRRPSGPGSRARRSACRDRWGTPWSPAFSTSCSQCWRSTARILIELFTDGGDAEIGRRLAEEVRLLRQEHGRDVWFLGKTLVASAGVTVMAAFPKEKRWLTRDAALLIHGRRMVKDLHLEGPLGSCRRVLEEMIADIDHGLRLEEQGFAELIDGANVDAEEIARRAYGGWYLSAEEALNRGLVAGLV